MKKYDREYFDKWYRSRSHRVNDVNEVRRKVALAISTAEYFLRRPIEDMLDVGCGEGAWFTHLRVLRRRAKYSGIDASEYAVERFGAERNISRGTLADLRTIQGAYDLVVCSDVLHYIGERELRAGVKHLERLTEGVAFIEVLTSDDDIVGDMDGLIRRPPAFYRGVFEDAGFVQAGAYCWLPRSMQDVAAELEIVK